MMSQTCSSKNKEMVCNQSVLKISISAFTVFSFKPCSPKLHLCVCSTTSISRLGMSLGLFSYFCFCYHCPMPCTSILYLGYCNSPPLGLLPQLTFSLSQVIFHISGGSLSRAELDSWCTPSVQKLLLAFCFLLE